MSNKQQVYQTFPVQQESVGVYKNGIIQGVEKLTEEENFEKYFDGNITLESSYNQFGYTKTDIEKLTDCFPNLLRKRPFFLKF